MHKALVTALGKLKSPLDGLSEQEQNRALQLATLSVLGDILTELQRLRLALIPPKEQPPE